MDHLGALVYFVLRLQHHLQQQQQQQLASTASLCPIYATLPVVNMGRLTLMDICRSKCLTEDFTLFSRQDVDAVFDRIIPMKYMENITLGGALMKLF